MQRISNAGVAEAYLRRSAPAAKCSYPGRLRKRRNKLLRRKEKAPLPDVWTGWRVTETAASLCCVPYLSSRILFTEPENL